MNKLATATNPVPAAYRKAVATAESIALRAGELYNSIIDGDAAYVTPAVIRELQIDLGKHTRRGTRIDESTRGILFEAYDALHAAELAVSTFGVKSVVTDDDHEIAASKLDEAADALDRVEDHVIGLFSPRRG